MSQQDNHLVTPIGQSLNAWAKQKIIELLEQQGRALPCVVTAIPPNSAGFVTVAFQVQAAVGQTPVTLPSVTLPILESIYVRLPIQVGDVGVTFAADAYLNQISGIGGGNATLGQPMNLGGLAFIPIQNVTWPALDNNLLGLSGGPDGVLIQPTTTVTGDGISVVKNSISATSNGSQIVMNASGITLSFGAHSIVINSSGVTIDGILWDTHTHTYTPGSGAATETSGPV